MHDCEALDPAAWSDPYEIIWFDWEISLREISSDTEELLRASYPDYETAWEPYVFGASTYWNGYEVAFADSDVTQYGFALQLDDDLVMTDEPITTEDVEAGADGYFSVYPTIVYRIP